MIGCRELAVRVYRMDFSGWYRERGESPPELSVEEPADGRLGKNENGMVHLPRSLYNRHPAKHTAGPCGRRGRKRRLEDRPGRDSPETSDAEYQKLMFCESSTDAEAVAPSSEGFTLKCLSASIEDVRLPSDLWEIERIPPQMNMRKSDSSYDAIAAELELLMGETPKSEERETPAASVPDIRPHAVEEITVVIDEIAEDGEVATAEDGVDAEETSVAIEDGLAAVAEGVAAAVAEEGAAVVSEDDAVATEDDATAGVDSVAIEDGDAAAEVDSVAIEDGDAAPEVDPVATEDGTPVAADDTPEDDSEVIAKDEIPEDDGEVVAKDETPEDIAEEEAIPENEMQDGKITTDEEKAIEADETVVEDNADANAEDGTEISEECSTIELTADASAIALEIESAVAAEDEAVDGGTAAENGSVVQEGPDDDRREDESTMIVENGPTNVASETELMDIDGASEESGADAVSTVADEFPSIMDILNEPTPQRDAAPAPKDVPDEPAEDDGYVLKSVIFRRLTADKQRYDRSVTFSANMVYFIAINDRKVELVGAPNSIASVEDLQILLQIVDDVSLSSFNVDLS